MNALTSFVPLPPVLGTITGKVDKAAVDKAYADLQQKTGTADKNVYYAQLVNAPVKEMAYGVPQHLKK